MKLTRKQFNLLVALPLEKPSLSQEELAEKIGSSPEEVSRLLDELSALGYIESGVISESGLEALEPYRAKRAILIAAGFGSRMLPITINTPKPLVRVHGKRIIDTAIDACLNAGIEEIYIVRGYLSELFDQLLYKYPMVKFLENHSYNQANNISSALCASHLFQNSYVIDADFIFSGTDVLKKYHYASNYAGIYLDGPTDDWCLEVRNGIIRDNKKGGINCWKSCGIGYWNAEDGAKLAVHMREAFEGAEGKSLYWEQIPLNLFRDSYNVEIYACQQGDLIELDTFQELKEFDSAYNV